MINYKLITDVPDHVEIQDSLTLKLWPEFMLNDPVSNQNWLKLFELFPEYQLSLIHNDEIIGVANSLPFYWGEDTFANLPEEGWDWVLQKGINDRLAGREANVLNGLQIAVNKKYQGQGISSIILKELIALARKKHIENVTIPVRPSLKSKYPLLSIDNYVNWKRENDLPFDPWLRVHVRFGGEIIKVCHQAMYIPGTIEEWEQWTGMKFLESSNYVIPGALNPVQIDLRKNLGEYVEPNVWVLHRVN